MYAFDTKPTPRLVAGAGSVARAGELARASGISRALVVSDPGVVAAGHAARVMGSLAEAGVVATLFAGVHENPTEDDARACAEAAREAGADGFVAIGGGSSIDAAKGANFLLTNGGPMVTYREYGRATRPMLPLVAIPTTAGTGSECQSYALISDSKTHAKMACGDPQAMARVAILDPELTLSQPPGIAAISAIDALVHAVETSVTRTRTAWSVLHAHEAFRLVSGAIRDVTARPGDVEARARMQLGAAMAGIAIEASMLGAAHSAANPLTARFEVPHGRAVGLMLPAVMKFNAADDAARAAYVALARAAGLGDDVDGLRREIEELLEITGTPRRLGAWGVRAADVPALAAEAATQWTAKHNPRPIDAEAFKALYERSL